MSNEVTHGQTRAKLIENGYAPAGIDRTFGFMSADLSGCILTYPGYASECELADYDKRRVIAIAITARDTRVRADILKVLAKYGVGKGPVRVASDGAELHVIKWDGYEVPYAMTDKLPGEYDPAAAVISQVNDERGNMRPALIRVGGEWRSSDLLKTKRSDLPALDSGKLNALFQEIKSVLRQHLPSAVYVAPLTPEAQAAVAERERLAAELAKRTDMEVLQLVTDRARVVSGNGLSGWERAKNAALVQTDQWRIETYDTIVSERREAEEAASVKASRAARLNKLLTDA